MASQSTAQDDEYRYLYVRALLLYWEKGEEAFLEELNALEVVLRENYQFSTEIWPIRDEGPFEALSEKLMAFLKDDENSSETLLIIYYGGHAKSTPGRHMDWTRYAP